VAHGTVQEIPEVPGDLREVFVTAHDISPEAHVRIQAAFQKCTDNAVSKTVNFPEDATEEEVAEVYRLAYQRGCKGVTIYRNFSRQEQVLRMGSSEPKAEAAAAGQQVLGEPRERPTAVNGTTVEMKTGCGKIYLTVNSDDRGPFEVFGNMGKAGGCVASQTEAVARLMSLAFRAGVKPEPIIKQLKGISCHMVAWEKGGGKILSCADAFAKAVERVVFPEAEQLAMDFNGSSFGHLGACPECGGALHAESGCVTCHDCGYSQCD
jgi:ribonucleoside-diphosphate reductase alpha chain